MVPGIDLKVDYAFKRVFGVEQNRDILIDLLDALLEPDDAHRIVDLQLQNPFNDRETADDKLSIVDVRARDQEGNQFQAEMQMYLHAFVTSRIIYYNARYYQSQLQDGEQYDALRPTISICFLNGELFPSVPKHKLVFKLRDEENGVTLSDDLQIYVVQLPKFTKTVEEVVTPLDQWVYFFKHAQELDVGNLPEPLTRPGINRALEVLKMVKEAELDYERYEARRRVLLDEVSQRSWEEKARKRARVDGLIEGRAEGIVEGRAEGIVEGRAEGIVEGRSEGRAEGRAEGMSIGGMIGRIQQLQELLELPVSTADELAVEPVDQLSSRLAELRSRFGSTSSGE